MVRRRGSSRQQLVAIFYFINCVTVGRDLQSGITEEDSKYLVAIIYSRKWTGSDRAKTIWLGKFYRMKE